MDVDDSAFEMKAIHAVKYGSYSSSARTMMPFFLVSSKIYVLI